MELHPDLVWSLRALAQDPEKQRALYPPFVVVADELVADFDDALRICPPDLRAQNPDIAALYALIDSKSGKPAFWTDEALDSGAFWKEIRKAAREILACRDLSIFAPHPSTAVYVSKDGVWDPRGEPGVPPSDGQKGTLVSALKRWLQL